MPTFIYFNGIRSQVLFGMVKHQIQLWFLLTILGCTQGDNHPKNNLPKFWLHTRYESKKRNGTLQCSWLPIGTYHENSGNLNLFIYFLNLQNLANLSQFWHEKSFV